MTDNVINFPQKKDKPKTNTTNVTDIFENVSSNIIAKAMVDIMKDLKLRRSDLYFDSHMIANDRIVQSSLKTLIGRMIELGTDPDPKPTGPIKDHKG